jgi:hypothetical protein
MSTAIVAYLIAAAFMMRWNIPSQEAADKAAKLWQQISEKL